jgi:hypothetical protein
MKHAVRTSTHLFRACTWWHLAPGSRGFLAAMGLSIVVQIMVMVGG